MALSRRQLRAIFAKMAAAAKAGRTRRTGLAETAQTRRKKALGTGPKNLGLKPPKRGSLVRSLISRDKRTVLDAKTVDRLVARLPPGHRKISKVNEIIIGSQKQLRVRMKKEGYSPLHRLIAKGAYSDETHNILLATDIRSRAGGTLTGYTRFTPARALGKSKERWTKVDSSSNLYHEYAHSMDSFRGFATTERWRKIVVKEWRPTTSLSSNLQPGIHREFWADAYASYALSKSSKMRLKRERPETHKYMKEFFTAESTKSMEPMSGFRLIGGGDLPELKLRL